MSRVDAHGPVNLGGGSELTGDVFNGCQEHRILGRRSDEASLRLVKNVVQERANGVYHGGRHRLVRLPVLQAGEG
jgi:hypothetical protein